MLEFIIGRAGTGKTEECLRAMQQEMRREAVGPALILLLPEHMTYKVERQLAAAMEAEGSGFLRAQVFGFRRFAQQVLLDVGGAAQPRITEIGRRLLLKRVLQAQEDKLRFFQRAARQRGFSASLAEAVDEFKSYGIVPERLTAAAEKVSDTRLQDKLQDLALLYDGFAASMAGRYNDAGDLLDKLAARLPEASLIAGAEIWVDGFIFFNPQEKQILRALLQQAKHVHITLPLDAGDCPEENRRETGIFHRAYRTFQELQLLAGELGQECRVRSLPAAHRFQAGGLENIEQQLFRFPQQPAAEATGIQLVEAATRRLEAEAAAADMLRLCREKGWHWRDIGVLLRDGDAYEKMLELVLQDYKIPFFSDSKRPGVHHPLAELVRSALEVLHGWRYDAVFRCLKTDFFPVTRGQADLLENYVLEFGIRGFRWTMAEDWHYRRGMQAEASEEELLALERINLVRRAVATPLAALEAAVGQAKNVRELTRAIYEFLQELAVPETLAKWAQEAEQAGRLVEAREHRQVWDDVMELLDQLVETSGEELPDRKEYEAVLGEGLDALEISLIPPGLDYVTIASFDQNSLDNVRAVYILGANEGIMPRRSQEKGLLSDAERLYLADAGVELSSGSVEGSFGEKYLLYRGFTEAREYLWVSYALADAAGNGLEPSPLVRRLRRIFPQRPVLSIPLESMERRDSLQAAEGRQAVSGLAAALRGCREKHQLASLWREVYNWSLEQPALQPALQMVIRGLFAQADTDRLPASLARQLYTKNRRLQGSVTRFERFRGCPFSHFAQYGLRLKERKVYQFQAPDRGNLLHDVLRAFGEELKAQGRRWQEVSSAEAAALSDRLVAELAPQQQNEILLSSAQYKNLLQRLQGAAESSIQRMIALDAVSQFHPAAFERSFGHGPGAMPPLTYALPEDCELEIMGTIDRIDIAEDGRYFVILDYKTGNAWINLLDVYYGLRLQLLTYLLAARNLLARSQQEPVLPAGMLYCFLKRPMLSVNHRPSAKEAEALLMKELSMPGWVLADPEIIRAIDSTLTFLPIRFKSNGELDSRSQARVKTEEEFAVLLDYVSYVLKDTGADILSGEISASPYMQEKGNACTYCQYHAVCGFDLQLPGFAYRKLPEAEDADIMEKMKEAGEEEGR